MAFFYALFWLGRFNAYDRRAEAAQLEAITAEGASWLMRKRDHLGNSAGKRKGLRFWYVFATDADLHR